MKEYALGNKFPLALQKWLKDEKMPETPKPGDGAFRKSSFSLTLGMDDLLHPAHHAAEALGFVTCCDNSTDEWPVEKRSEEHTSELQSRFDLVCRLLLEKKRDDAIDHWIVGHR